MTTLVNIHDNLKSIARRHKQIHTFEYDPNIADYNTSGTTIYPTMVVVPTGSTAKRGEIGYKYTIYVLDLVEKGLENQLDVTSDTHQVAIDIISELMIVGRKATNPTYAFDLRLDNIPITPILENRFDNEEYGHSFDIILWVEWDVNQCAIPQTT